MQEEGIQEREVGESPVLSLTGSSETQRPQGRLREGSSWLAVGQRVGEVTAGEQYFITSVPKP